MILEKVLQESACIRLILCHNKRALHEVGQMVGVAQLEERRTVAP